MNIYKNFILGFRRERRKMFFYSLSAFGIIWTLLDAVSTFLISDDTLDIYTRRWLFVIFLILGSLLCSLIMMYPKREVIIHLNKKTSVKIFFGDVLEQNGIIAIPVSQFFETDIKDYISENSLQAQVIRKAFKNELNLYKDRMRIALSKSKFELEIRGENSKAEKKYDIGTTAVIKKNDNIYLHFAITETELKKYKQAKNADIRILLKSLSCLWIKVKEISHGETITIPLIGDGITGIGQPPKELLMLNLIAINDALSGDHNIKNINIVIYKDNFNKMDLKEIERYWKS